MKKILLSILVILLLIAGVFLWRIAPEANGYTAKYLCSLTYTSGLDPVDGFEQYVKPIHFLFRGVVPEIDREKKEMTARYFGFIRPRTAMWREGCGCTLLVNMTKEELQAHHDIPNRLMVEDSIMYQTVHWPEGNNIDRDSLDPAIHWQEIDRILDEAMKETTDDPVQKDNTLALVIAWKGHLIGERYAKGVHQNTPLSGWSTTKTVTGSLAGVMVQKHALDITVPIGLPEWEGDVRKGITINHLLRMETGLDFEEDYAPMADATKMLYETADMGQFAAAHHVLVAPGERWAYSSGTSNVLADILYTEMGSTPASLHRLAYEEFFNRLGITTAVFEHDESDAFVGSSYLYMSACDWLRVCKLYMDDGLWNGERILPVGWVKYALTPAPHATDACFGAHIWLNASEDPAKRKYPALPADAFMMRGYQGQCVIGIPSMDLMLTRIGVTNREEGWSPEEVINKVIAELTIID